MKEKAKSNSKFWLFTLIILAVIAISACLCVGMTYAYFLSIADKDIGSVTVGTLHLDGVTQADGAEFQLPTEPIVPNQHIANVNLKAQVSSNISYYTRVAVGAVVKPAEGHEHISGEYKCADYVENDVDILDIKFGDSVDEAGVLTGESYHQTTNPNLNGENVYYKLSPTSVSSPLEATHDENFALSIQLKDFVGDDFCEYYMDATIQIIVKFEVVQADYLKEASEGNPFDQADSMHTTWESVSPTKFDIAYFKGTFEDSSWELINSVARTGKANEVFHVGDEKTFNLTDGQTETVIILDFNHDELSDGTGKAGITLGVKYTKAGDRMAGRGWDQSFMRTYIMKNYFNKLPADLKPYVKTVNKKATGGVDGHQIIVSQDNLWLLSVSEICSEEAIKTSTRSILSNYADLWLKEGTQYEYYKNLIGDTDPNIENSALVKKNNDEFGSATSWHLRSFFIDNYDGRYYYHYMTNKGRIGAQTDNGTASACFNFCI